MMATPPPSSDRPGIDRPIQRSDIESRLRAAQAEVKGVKDSTVGIGIAAGGLAALLLLLLAFLIGKRIGTKKYSFVEIRRH
jgi:hypothetical protein